MTTPPQIDARARTTAGTVGDAMTRDVVVLHEEDNLLDVARDMGRYRFRHLPVVDGTRLVGIVSHRDLLRCTVSRLELGPGLGARDEHLKEQTFVARVMTRGPSTVHPETPLADAARTMVNGRFGCLPVVDAGGARVGILTEHDLLRVAADRL